SLLDWEMRPKFVSDEPQVEAGESASDDEAVEVAPELHVDEPGAQHAPEYSIESEVLPGPAPIAQSPEPSVPEVAGQAKEPEEQTGLEIRVGTQLDGFRKEVRFLNLGDTALNQLNMGVVGDLGTGKTQLLKSIVFQIADGAPENR